MTPEEITSKFNEGYGKVVVDGVYHKNPSMSQSQAKKAGTYHAPSTLTDQERQERHERMIKGLRDEMIADVEFNRSKLSLLEAGKIVAKLVGGKIVHQSKSGSVYINANGKSIRVSNHYIMDRDPMKSVNNRFDFEIVESYFTKDTDFNELLEGYFEVLGDLKQA